MNQLINQYDRNFDPIADHFAKKVYGSLKGQIRLAVLNQDISELLTHLPNRPLKILDVGAGMGQISLNLAKNHQVTLNDISQNMLNKAKENALSLSSSPESNIEQNLRFICCPYQDLYKKLTCEKFDVILCHALLEWLAHPDEIMGFFDNFLAENGLLSLCFYNPSSIIYRNLVMGNFYQLDTPKPATKKSLTPNNPVAFDEVQQWLNNHNYQTLIRSGIRVFSDYAPLKRGGLNHPDDVIAMELKYARTEPFWRMGRYLHLAARKITDKSDKQCL